MPLGAIRSAGYHGRTLFENLYMTKDSPFDRLSQGFSDTLAGFFPGGPPAGLTVALDDLVAQNLARFQLVPREEFDRQVALLERLQAQIRGLEDRLGALEARD